MTQRLCASFALLVTAFAPAAGGQSAPAVLVRVPLIYRAPGDGRPTPNFSPKGTQVALTTLPVTASLPSGATHPAKTGTIKVGPSQQSWIPVLATASAEHPQDLVLLYLDRNRNGTFTDDGAPLTGAPAQNAKTKAWWTSINKIELSVPYAASKRTEPYLVNFWIVREDSAAAPDVLRYSVGSWRYGTATVNGVDALVAAMDADNDALFGKDDMWSILGAAEPKAEQAVLSINEARPTNRLMFVPGSGKDIVLQFRGFSPEGAYIDFEVIDKPVTKLSDRAPDDLLRNERPRPRADVPFVWGHGGKEFDAAVAKAKATGKKIFVDFEATWCGPCHTMDQWIWTDAEVAAALNADYIGVKIDADLEKALIKRFAIGGYPTMVILDSSGKEARRVVDYQDSAAMMAFLRK
jgi:thiol-disulfide isomerase/thioredoxin